MLRIYIIRICHTHLLFGITASSILPANILFPSFPGNTSLLSSQSTEAKFPAFSSSRTMTSNIYRSPTHSYHLEALHSTGPEESARWLSHIVQELWPYAANVAQLTLLEYVQPALDAAVPPGLPSPRFTRIDVGNDPLHVEFVRVYERHYSSTDTCPILEADIVYDGKPLIEMTLGGSMTFGVQDAKVKGRVEILLRPLLYRIPMVGAMQVAFINRPQIDYTLTGLAAVGDQSFIRGLVKRVVEDVLASIAVLPHRVAFKVAPDTDYLHFVAKPLGVLRVGVVSGTGFPSTDVNPFKQAIGQSALPDVYLYLMHGSTSYETQRVDNDADPVWTDQVFDFVLTTESRSQHLTIEAYDFDVGQDDFLGHANIRVQQLVEMGSCEIELCESPDDARPIVNIMARWLHLSTNLRHVQEALLQHREDKARPETCSSLLLSVEIDEAKNLPPKRRPYVRVRVGKHRFKTNAAYEMPGIFSVENPDFEQSFHVPLTGVVDAGLQITFEVVDFYTGIVMGYAFTTLADVIQASGDGKVYNFALIDAERPDASLRVRVRLAAVQDETPPLWEQVAAKQQLENA